ncbi:MAG: T9SS type A sorting domain-containing protein [Saprospiraceae bacterium]
MKFHQLMPSLLYFACLCFSLPAQSILHETKPPVSQKELQYRAAEKSPPLTAYSTGPVFPMQRPTITAKDLAEFATRSCEGDEEENPVVEYLKEQAAQGLLPDFADAVGVDMLPAGKENGPQDAISATLPSLYSSFNATAIGSGNPPDNAMAISNTGYIVTAVNSSIAIYNSSGTSLGSWTLYSFMNGAGEGVVNDFFDPTVLYDSGSNRFFLVCVVGRTPADSRLALGFSSSSNPTNSWNFYYLPGNILNNNCWFDFPRIGYSTSEVYIAGNLFNTTNSFNQAVIFQIPKAAGYAGNSLNYQYWYGISGAPFTLCPVSFGGTGSYGPGAYFVAHPSGTGTMTKFYNLTDNMSASNEQLLYYPITVTSYAIGPNAAQKNTTEKLDVGDSRIQNAVYMSNCVHYVYCAKANGTQNGIHYDRLNVTNNTIVNKRIYSTGGEAFTYPAVAWVGGTSTDKSVLISFQFSKSTVFPGVGALNVDNANNVSSWLTCATGTGFVNQNNTGNQTVSRWGDYTALCRRAGSNPLRVWGGASFGNTSNQYTCKIFQIGINGLLPDDPPVEERGNGDNTQPMVTASVYPNPVADGQVNIAFDNLENREMEIRLLSPLGVPLRTLYSGQVQPSLENLSLDVSDLQPGSYFVQILNGKKTVSCEKIFVVSR